MKYKKIVFIDSNVALQCLDLTQLPWKEIDLDGPLLVLVVPTVLKEVDSKKNDARLSKHARRFNGHLRPLLMDQEYLVIKKDSPVVHLKTAICGVIDWGALPGLDRVEPDHKIIAESLNVVGYEGIDRIFVSQDILPLSLAKHHNLSIRHVGENWLRQKEMSEAEKKFLELQREAEKAKSNQPEIKVECVVVDELVHVIKIDDLEVDERDQIINSIVERNPPVRQKKNDMLGGFNFDSRYEEKYFNWVDEVPQFVNNLERCLNININQARVKFVISNVGKVRADVLDINLKISGGAISEKFTVLPVSYKFPPVPDPYPFHVMPQYHGLFAKPSPVVKGIFDVSFEEAPSLDEFARIECTDFRQGRTAEVDAVLWFDPSDHDDLVISVSVTARNMAGVSEFDINLCKAVRVMRYSDFYDENLVPSDTYKKNGVFFSFLGKDDEEWRDYIDFIEL